MTPTNAGLGYLTSLAVSAIALATSFEWITWTQDQQNNVLTFLGLVFTGLFALNTLFGRPKQIRTAAKTGELLSKKSRTEPNIESGVPNKGVL